MLNTYTAAEIVEIATSDIGYWAELEMTMSGPLHQYTIVAVECDGEPEDMPNGPVKLTATKLREAATTLLKMYPNSAAANYIRINDLDAEAGDMMCQIAVFGEVVFG